MTKLVCGWGINDADYVVQPKRTGQSCPFYSRWHSMLVRCYSTKYHSSSTYTDCLVCNEWLTFSNFKLWMEGQVWVGKQLDKDFLGDGKLYSPGTCCFVEPWLNSIFSDHGGARGVYPMGVSLHKASGKMSATLSNGRKQRHLGLFSSMGEAQVVYLIAKKEYIMKKMEHYPDPRVKAAVLEKCNEFCALPTH